VKLLALVTALFLSGCKAVPNTTCDSKTMNIALDAADTAIALANRAATAGEFWKHRADSLQTELNKIKHR
jgi:starvation-inducible outer membrane lipoprotein